MNRNNMKMNARAYINGWTLPARFVAIIMIGYKMNPNAIPSEIEYVNGIPMTIKNEGAAIAKSSQSMLRKFSAINTPTTTKAGAVTCDVTTVKSGENIKAKMNKIPVVIDVKPERPPTAIPDEDST